MKNDSPFFGNTESRIEPILKGTIYHANRKFSDNRSKDLSILKQTLQHHKYSSTITY